MTITEFLLARIAEDETNAKAAIAWVAGGPTPYFGWYGAPGDEVSKRFGGAKGHIVRHSPNRVLAECAAKRALVELHFQEDLHTATEAEDCGDCMTLYILAAVYKDHPDYRQEWAL